MGVGQLTKGNGPHKSCRVHHQLQVQGIPRPFFDSMVCQKYSQNSPLLCSQLQFITGSIEGGFRCTKGERMGWRRGNQPDTAFFVCVPHGVRMGGNMKGALPTRMLP